MSDLSKRSKRRRFDIENKSNCLNHIDTDENVIEVLANQNACSSSSIEDISIVNLNVRPVMTENSTNSTDENLVSDPSNSYEDEYVENNSLDETATGSCDHIGWVRSGDEPEPGTGERIVCNAKCCESLELGIKNWMQEEKNVSTDSVTRLLKILKKDFPYLPSCAKTLKKGKYGDLKVVNCDGGEYFHCFNWISCLQKYIENCSTNTLNTSEKEFRLSVNIDGLPLYNNNSCYTCYPILVKPIITGFESRSEKVITVGIYCSNRHDNKGMPDIELFLKEFMSDIKKLQDDGVETRNGIFKLLLGPFVCDSPVRSTLKEIRAHAGYAACERCEEYGTYEFNRVVFLGTNSNRRTNVSFLLKTDKAHHNSRDPLVLESIFSEFVDGFVLDYMHCCCLGIMKRILSRLLTTKTNDVRVHLDKDSKKLFSQKLKEFQSFIPCDFARKLEGGIELILQWKASQFRLFMLYVGIVIFRFRNIVSKDIYENFLAFSVAMKLLLSDGQQPNCEVIEKLLENFALSAKEIYGHSFMSYNVHSSIHLVDDYRKYGNLDYISAFVFESFLGSQIKNSVRSGYQPLKQIAAHVIKENERNLSFRDEITEITLSKQQKCTHGYGNQNKCYKKIVGKFVLKTQDENSCANSCIQLKNGKIGLIDAIHESDEGPILNLRLFKKRVNFFDIPVESCTVGVYEVSKPFEIKKVHYNEIYCKMMILPYKQSFITQVLPHSVS